VELPLLEPVYKKYQDQGFEIIAFDVRADDARAKAFIAEKGLTYTLLSGGREEAMNSYKISATPSSFFIDRDGKVVKFKLGFTAGDEAQVDELVASLLK
jgi:peroxiredoxin